MAKKKKKLDSVKKIKCKVKMKRGVKNNNFPVLMGQKITPGKTYDVELTEADLATKFIKHWFTVSRGVLNKVSAPAAGEEDSEAAVHVPPKISASLPHRASA